MLDADVSRACSEVNIQYLFLSRMDLPPASMNSSPGYVRHLCISIAKKPLVFQPPPPLLHHHDQSPALIGHLIWMAYLAFNLGFVKSLAFFTVAQCGCGLFLALVFGLGHNGMATYDADARPDFWKLQVCFFMLVFLR